MTSFILLDDEVNFLKSNQKLRLIVNQVYWWNARKQSSEGSNFASDFPIRQACRNFWKANIFFLRIDQVSLFSTKNNGIIKNDIEENVLFYRVVRVIPH